MTTTLNPTLQRALTAANPNNLADALRKVNPGKTNAVIKVVVTGMTANASPDITSATDMDGTNTVTGYDLGADEQLPAIGQVVSLRVTASGTAASLGTYGITDVGGTAIIPPGGASAAMGIAKLSDDGKEITFPNTVTAFVLQYIPRSETPVTDTFQI